MVENSWSITVSSMELCGIVLVGIEVEVSMITTSAIVRQSDVLLHCLASILS